MKSYKTLTDSTAELVVSRSRFIAYVYTISGEEDAKARLAALRKEHHAATHICYAYIADEAGLLCKSSDDGEPSQTAGAPIMSVISGYRMLLVAVVRYFGGTKLGVGGLIKAYTEAAAKAVMAAAEIEYILSDIYRAEMSFAQYEKCRKALSACKTLTVEYGQTVRYEFAAYAETDIISKITDILGCVPEILLLEKDRFINYQ